MGFKIMLNQNWLSECFTSNEFCIVTPEIIKLKKNIVKWISDGIPGGIIYGRPRIGKTYAILYILKELKKIYGSELPVYILNTSNHTPKAIYFYSEFLKCVGHAEFARGTACVLKDRLLNRLFSDACSTRSHKIVLFVDEAYNMTEKDFSWLMDIYNNLFINDVHMYVFLVGSEELMARKHALVLAKQHQIVGRFMVNEWCFHGIRNEKEMTICLANYDKPMNIGDHTIIMTKEFYPQAFADGKKLYNSAGTLMNLFRDAMNEINLPSNSEIPMMYFVNTVKHCLEDYGETGKKLYFPDEKAWKNSIDESGYILSERLYYNV